MRVLVTGGAGYVGSHTCKELKKRGHTPLVFDSLEKGFQNFVKWGEFFKGDVRNVSDLETAFRNFKPEAVMHFAAISEVGESVKHPELFYEQNVVGSLNLLKIARQNNCLKFIFSSTAAVYGIPKDGIVRETDLPNPINPYGKTKWAIEQALQDFFKAYNLCSVSLRYFNAAGNSPEAEIGENHQPESHLIPIVLQAALGKLETLSIFGDDYPTPDGTCIRDYVHVEDLAVAHVASLSYLQNKKGAYALNLGTQNGRSVQEIVETARKVTGKTIRTQIKDRREGDPPKLVSDNRLAQQELQWQPKYDIAEQIAHAWKWTQRLFS